MFRGSRRASGKDDLAGIRRLYDLRDGREKAAAYARGRLLEVGIGSGASLEELGRGGELREMDAQALDFPEHSFDSVAFSLCLCTIPDPARALREAIRVAKPGAPMTVLEHVRSDRMWVALPQDLLNVFSRAIHDRVNQRTEELVRAAGIEVLSAERWALGAITLIAGRVPG